MEPVGRARPQAQLEASRAKVQELTKEVDQLRVRVARLEEEVAHERRLRMMAEGSAAEEQMKYKSLRYSRAGLH